MANRLSKIVNKPKAKTSKQKPVPVRIVYDTPQVAETKKTGIDKYDAQEALRILQRAADVQNNKPLMRAAKAEAKAQIKALSSVK